MRLSYRGIPYEPTPTRLTVHPPIHELATDGQPTRYSPRVPASVRVLRYRGLCYVSAQSD